MISLLRSESDTLVIFDRDFTVWDPVEKQPMPGVKELFRELNARNATIAIVTAGANEITERFLVEHNLDGPVSLMVSGSGDGRCMLVKAEAEKVTGIKFAAKHTFVVDDDYHMIYQAAKLGFNGIGVLTGRSSMSDFQRLAIRPRAIFKDLSDTTAVVGTVMEKNGILQRYEVRPKVVSIR